MASDRTQCSSFASLRRTPRHHSPGVDRSCSSPRQPVNNSHEYYTVEGTAGHVTQSPSRLRRGSGLGRARPVDRMS